jgi:aminopeptidase N
MFPGWDEPAFKATFTLSVVLPSGFRAISNMPIAHEEPAGPDRKQVTFGTSPKMSTYLLVLSAGDLERISRTIAGIDVGVNVPSGRTGQARYALDTVITQVLPYYVEYFGVPYPPDRTLEVPEDNSPPRSGCADFR